MRRVFKLLVSLSLVLAILVPFGLAGASTVMAEGENVYINVDNFPDENFRNHLLNTTVYTTDPQNNAKCFYSGWCPCNCRDSGSCKL